MDWLDRLREERQQLHERRKNLLLFIGSCKFRDLPECEQEALQSQHDIMRAYEAILYRRIVRAEKHNA